MRVVRKIESGRTREAAEVVRLRRAAAVGQLMLGELDTPLTPIRLEEYASKPRRELKAEVVVLRKSLKRELDKFCRENFIGANPEKLADLHEDICLHETQYRLPLHEFIERVGRLKKNVLKGAPAHATVCLSLWGLQTEFPEMHLARDLALSYNDALAAEEELQKHRAMHWGQAKKEEVQSPIAATLSRGKYSMRMCLLSCFNLTEAFINGVAWEFVQSKGVESLSKRQQGLLTGGQASLSDKIAKVPAIVIGQDDGPFAKNREPLLTFSQIVKPFRDSIVHASPFSAPERFGGYDKLERVYGLEIDTVTTAVDLTVEIISTIHSFIGSGTGLPAWMPSRAPDGHFIME